MKGGKDQIGRFLILVLIIALLINFISSISDSKIVNNRNVSISGNIEIILQKYSSGNWQDFINVTNKTITVPANSVFEIINDWNNLNIKLNEYGDYRAYAKFQSNDEIFNDTSEFNVSYLNGCFDSDGQCH